MSGYTIMPSKNTKQVIKPCGALTSDIAPFFCNPYTWCAAQCGYCWARHYARPRADGRAWPAKDYDWIKHNITNELILTLNNGENWKGKNVWVGNFADAYQQIEQQEKLTRSCIENLHVYGAEVTILTKFGLAVRDLDLAPEHVGISLISMDERWRKRLEPHADSAEARIAVIKEAHASGCGAFVNIEPLLRAEDFMPIYEAVADHVDYILVGMLNPRQKSTVPMHYPDYGAMKRYLVEEVGAEKLDVDVRFKRNF